MGTQGKILTRSGKIVQRSGKIVQMNTSGEAPCCCDAVCCASPYFRLGHFPVSGLNITETQQITGTITQTCSNWDAFDFFMVRHVLSTVTTSAEFDVSETKTALIGTLGCDPPSIGANVSRSGTGWDSVSLGPAWATATTTVVSNTPSDTFYSSGGPSLPFDGAFTQFQDLSLSPKRYAPSMGLSAYGGTQYQAELVGDTLVYTEGGFDVFSIIFSFTAHCVGITGYFSNPYGATSNLAYPSIEYRVNVDITGRVNVWASYQVFSTTYTVTTATASLTFSGSVPVACTVTLDITANAPAAGVGVQQAPDIRVEVSVTLTNTLISC